MTQMIDYNWQVQNKPPAGQALVDNNPSTGPYLVNELIFDNQSLLFVDAAGNVFGQPAGYLQGGFLTPTNQHISGDKIFWADPSISVAGYLVNTGPSVELRLADTQPGGSFPSSYNGTLFCQTPFVGLDDVSGGSLLFDNSLRTASLSAVGTLGIVGAGQLSLCPGGADTADLLGNSSVSLSMSNFRSIALYVPADLLCDLTDGSGGTFPSFSINQRTVGSGGIGKWGTLGIDATVSGGIITALGAGGLSGDVSGPASSNTLSAIAGNPVLAPFPVLGDTLTWNGSDWVNAPSYYPVSLSSPAAGDYAVFDGTHWINYPGPYPVALTSPSAGDVLEFDGSTWINTPGGGGAVASVSNSDGTLTISPTTGAVVASLNLNNANQWTAQQDFHSPAGTTTPIIISYPGTGPSAADLIYSTDGSGNRYFEIFGNGSAVFGNAAGLFGYGVAASLGVITQSMNGLGVNVGNGARVVVYQGLDTTHGVIGFGGPAGGGWSPLVPAVIFDDQANVVIGNGLSQLSASATDGFLFIPSCNGTPVGTPTTVSGVVPIVFDSSANILYGFNGGTWRII